MISVDLAQFDELPSRNNQDGPLYFLSPLTAGLFGITEEGVEGAWNVYLSQNTERQKEWQFSYAMILHFLDGRAYKFDKLVGFADNTLSQNKNMYKLEEFSMISA